MPDSEAPAIVAEPEGQQAESEAVVAPDPVAPSQEVTPAPEAIPADGEGEPADVWADDAVWSELQEKYPDRFPKPEPVPEATPTALTPRPNPLRESVATAGREAAGRMQQVTRQFNAGEITELPESFMADVESFGSWTNAEAEGRQLDLAERLFERALGIDPNKLDAADPLQGRYADALDKRAQAHVNAFREFNRVYRETDPAKRSAILARAEQQQATATAAFLLERDALLVEHGKALGAAETEKAAGKRLTKAVETAGKNGQIEAIARAQADLLARKATATASMTGKPERPDAELLADPNTPIQTLIEIRARQRRGE